MLTDFGLSPFTPRRVCLLAALSLLACDESPADESTDQAQVVTLDGGSSMTPSVETPRADAGALVSPAADGLFVAPSGRAEAPGTLAAPTTLSAAIARVKPGQTIYLRGGVYRSTTQITIARGNSGTAAAPKRLFAYEGELPILDFSGQPYGRDGNQRGLQIDASFWHVRGLVAEGSADNGIYVAGNSNVIERCITRKNRDTGLQLGRYASSASSIADWPANNLILNCESYDNYDAPPGSGENADGFAAKLTVGPGNVFRGCVAHHNIDDGWDLYTKTETGPIGVVTIDQSIAHHNGTLTSGLTNPQGDRNGFKLGGERIPVAHIVTRSVAFSNGKNGFTWNSNPGAIQLVNTLAFDNVEGNYKFGDNATTTAAVFTNNISLRTGLGQVKADKAVGRETPGSNVWVGATSRLTATLADFSRPLSTVSIMRKSDGSLDLSPFALAAGSRLIDAGARPLGPLPFDSSYYSGLPDLGVVEVR